MANARFRGRDDLVLLVIDPGKIVPELRYEGPPGGDSFPHIYGPLNADAVDRVVPFPPTSDGAFAMPAGL